MEWNKVSLVVVLLALGVLISGCLSSEATEDGILVNPSWVAERVDDPNVRIIDLSVPKEKYDDGHIKNAVWVDWKKDIADPNNRQLYEIAPENLMEQLLGRLGVSRETTLVLYDNADNMPAVRMYYVLKYYGHDDVRILNGGVNTWTGSGNELTSDVPEITQTHYSILGPRTSIIAEMETVQDSVGREDIIIIDGRPEKFYVGDAASSYMQTGEKMQYGHIPSAVNVPWKSNLNDDGTLKSKNELRALYENQGITNSKKVITYCSEGPLAAFDWFVLKEVLGYPNVAVYEGSFGEWSLDPENEVETAT